MRQRAVAAILLSAAAVLASPGAAFAHSAFRGSSPAPGGRSARAPDTITLTFTAPLDGRLARATLTAADGRAIAASRVVDRRGRLVLKPRAGLARGAYRVTWHSVSAEDGHVLDGSLSFGVRAAAASPASTVERSPLARQGWIRVLARLLLDAALLVFTGALVWQLVLARAGGDGTWPPAPGTAVAPEARQRARRRQRALTANAGLAAGVTAMLAAVADARDAADGLAPAGLSAYLTGTPAGQARLAVVALVLAAAGMAARSPRAAAALGTLALGGVAFAGHASAAGPRGLAIAVDWLHLSAAAVWLAGIALLAVVWGPLLGAAGGAGRRAAARELLAPLAGLALPAFAVAVLTGGAGAVIELGRAPALWETAYGRVLVVKMGLVALLAVATGAQALRLRARLAEDRDERRRRRSWTAPVTGAAVLVCVAFLAAFPLPPRQAREVAEARAAAGSCGPCPVRAPAAGQLAVAEQLGSHLVALRVTPDGDRRRVEVELFDVRGRRADAPLRIAAPGAVPCGRGCWRVVVQGPAARLGLSLREQGRTFAAALPLRWRRNADRRARAILERAEATMRSLASVREREVVVSIPGRSARTVYRLQAPDRLAYESTGGDSIQIAKRVWVRRPSDRRWRPEPGDGLSFRTASWFRWTPYAKAVRLLSVRGRLAELALMDPGPPVWHRLVVDLRTYRVLRARVIAYGRYATERYGRFDGVSPIEPPPAFRRSGRS